MAHEDDERDYRIAELERKVKGMQRQLGVTNARMDSTTKRQDMRIRDLEIKQAVKDGVAQNKVAKIYEISPGRVNQILKKVG